MNTLQNPAKGIEKLTDFSASITPDPKGFGWRKIEISGGTQVRLIFLDGTDTTFLLADYARIDNHAVFIRTIHSDTDATAIWAHK